jgi:hypothetical protein
MKIEQYHKPTKKRGEAAKPGTFGSGTDNPKVNPDCINESGRTPRQEVDYWRAMQIKARVMREAGEMVYRSDVAESVSRQWNAIANDLRYTLPGEVADRLTGKVASAVIRKAVREAAESLIENWKRTGGNYGPVETTTGKPARNRK